MTEPNLQFPAVKSAKIFGFLRKFCGFLRFPAPLQMLEFPREGANLRKSTVFCEDLRFGRSLSPQFRHLRCLQEGKSQCIPSGWAKPGRFGKIRFFPLLCSVFGPYGRIKTGRFGNISLCPHLQVFHLWTGGELTLLYRK